MKLIIRRYPKLQLKTFVPETYITPVMSSPGNCLSLKAVNLVAKLRKIFNS